MDDDLKRLAERLELDPERIQAWRGKFVKPAHSNGRPKGRQPRPPGMIAIGDARRKYNLKTHVLQRWREQGLPHTIVGTMVLFDQKVLREWVRRGGSGQ